MTKTLEPQRNRLFLRINAEARQLLVSLKNYLNRLMFPIYLFPIKLITYTLYYVIKFVSHLVLEFLKMIRDALIFPFKSLRNFLKSGFILFLTAYILVSGVIMADYIIQHYGWYNKFLCSAGSDARLKDSVVRVVGGSSEGTGFFIDGKTILTNFHVIASEPSPKIIFPDGSFTTAVGMVGDRDADLALIKVDKDYSNMVLPLMAPVAIYENEPLIAVGYPEGTSITGQATVLKGNFIDFRSSRIDPVEYIQTDINLGRGMSGGPLVDNCGNVAGINTLAISGGSFFISADSFDVLRDTFTDKDIVKVELNPSKSPADAVNAFYTYLKVRDMQKGFNLLSADYLKNTDYGEWANRFPDVLDVTMLDVQEEIGFQDRVRVKFVTKNWNYDEVDYHFYEGTWDTVLEDGVYKMLSADIAEVEDPSDNWFWKN